MPFTKITPNLMVRDIATSLGFYQGTLGFERTITVPEKEPFVFVALGARQTEIFLNQNQASQAPVAGGMSLYLEVEDLKGLLSRVQEQRIKIEIPLNETFYGMREFAVLDPDGYLLIFAEPIAK